MLTLVVHKQDPLEFAIRGPVEEIVHFLELAREHADEYATEERGKYQRLLDEADSLRESAVRYVHDPEEPR